MSKLARSSVAARPRQTRGALRTEAVPTGKTFEGGAGYAKDVKTELFTLAVTNFVSEKSFYEDASTRDARYVKLIHQATAEDPQWTADFLKWLRGEGNMRTASIVGAIEYGRTLSDALQLEAPVTVDFASAPSARAVLNSVMLRADEPGEALGYWIANYGRPLPMWLKRAIGDGAIATYTPFNVLKYDGQGQAVRFGDVLQMSQINPNTGSYSDSRFKWILDRRYNRTQGDYEIDMLARRQGLEQIPVADRKAWLAGEHSADLLNKAGFTWESLSGWLQGPMDAAAWEAIIPSMGYMALLRNLRNFDEAGVSKEVATKIAAKLADPVQVAKSRQLPMRFLTAYMNTPSDRWKVALGEALDFSLKSVPTLPGRTLVLIDTSGSMNGRLSDRSSLALWELAAMFGIVLAAAPGNDAEIRAFDTNVYPEFKLIKGASALSSFNRFHNEFRGGGGTYTRAAIQATYKGHDRIVVLTDGQAWSDGVGVFADIPATVPTYTYDISGYQFTHHQAGTENRRLVSGLTDAGFKMMSLLEKRSKDLWPWQGTDTV